MNSTRFFDNMNLIWLTV